MKLKGKVAIVTGGGRGIGRQICLALAGEGAAVAAADVDGALAGKVCGEIEAKKGKAVAVEVDVANSPQTAKMVADVLDKLGRVDILINNAGITSDALLVRMKESEWDQVIAVNLKGCFNCTQAVVRAMMKQKSGRIVNVSSIIGIMGNAGQANYSASKAGIIGFTKSCARELASRGINVNAVAPGFIETGMTDKLPADIRGKMLGQIPLGRFGGPEDVAAAVLFLVSPESAYITGQVIQIDGGMLM